MASKSKKEITELNSITNSTLVTEEKVRKAKEVYNQNNTSSEIVNEYFSFLINLHRNEKEENLKKEIVKETKRVFNQNSDSEEVTKTYFLFLFYRYYTSEEEFVKEECLKEAKRVFDQNNKSEETAIDYLSFLFRLSKKEKEGSEKERFLEEAKRVYNQNNSEQLINRYFKLLNFLIRTKDNMFLLQKVADEARRVYEQNTTSEEVVKLYFKFLSELLWGLDGVYNLPEAATEAKRVYDKAIGSEEITSIYFNFLSDYSWRQGDIYQLEEVAREAKRVYRKYESSESVAMMYLRVLSTLLRIKGLIEEAVKESERVYRKYKLSENVVEQYLIFLSNCSPFSNEEFVSKKIARRARSVYRQLESSEKVRKAYLRFLSSLIFWNKEETALLKVLKESKSVYNYQPSENIAKEYFYFLRNLCMKDRTKTALKKIAKEAKTVYEQYAGVELLARGYLFFLRYLYNCQSNEIEWKSSEGEAQRVYEQYHSSETIAQSYLRFLMSFSLNKIENVRISRITEKIINLIQSNENLINSFEEFLDQLILSNDFSNSEIEKFSILLMSFTKFNLSRDLFRNTKYDLIFNNNKNMSDTAMEKVIAVFILIQVIKRYLIVRNPTELVFGHYTSGKVLQIHLKQKENKRYSIMSRSRLNNVNYMNDPSEGKVLDQVLGLEKIFQDLALKPSPWFLMSLTTAIDRLAMWAQYGAQAKGVCLVLDSKDFETFIFPSKIPNFTAVSHSPTTDKVFSDNKLNGESKDILYRIGYLSTQKDKHSFLKKDYNTCFEDDEIRVINDLLQKLQDKIKEIELESRDVDKDKVYEKINDCLEEIRYLFKSADYSYESELRVLKYVPLEPNNKKIKIDDSGDFAKLYIERDNPIKLSEVIFGPKFQNPENITPLLYLLNKNIKFRQSDISFR